jgi:hypothetical protein
MPDNDLQKLSPAYRLPASDPDFISAIPCRELTFCWNSPRPTSDCVRGASERPSWVLGSARILEANGDARRAPEAASWRAGMTNRAALAGL